MLLWLKRVLRGLPQFNSDRYAKWLYDLDSGMFDDEIDVAASPTEEST